MKKSAKRAAGDGPRYPIESVDNALRLILMFRDRPMIGVSESARELSIAPSTAHRLLAMLLHHGFVRHDPVTRGYRAGKALVDVGLAIVRDFDIRRRALPHLRALVERVDETAHLVSLDGREVLFMDGVECDGALRAAARTGSRLPAHCTAGGKALLSQLDDEELARTLGPGRLTGLTPRSIVRRSDLEEELQRVRERGYATNRGESEPNLWAVAAPIPQTSLASPPTAVVVSAPAFRVDERWLDGTGQILRDVVEAIIDDTSPDD